MRHEIDSERENGDTLNKDYVAAQREWRGTGEEEGERERAERRAC
jgi:hypothetical protein